ncbi:TrkA family protein [Cytobacillus oceanisediminis]|uniref:TrkA family protein n=1 Tax=Cytobacillus oceanisediminis TaxID=665099 RepID=A0A2V3A178_9BACI|nr:NAD-binding protein [Cytobacillus oceanisediminis]PWW30556.1 TrkA family protein [Cytobacillus oceanisediminis]
MQNFNHTKFNNILIIGWNERSKNLIEVLTKIYPALKVMVIDQSFEEEPEYSSRIQFISGNSMHDKILKKSNIHHINAVFITADRRSSEATSDSKSIISLLAIKSLNPSVYTVIEILSNTQILNAKRAGADKVIYTSEIFANSVISKIRRL